MKSEIGVARVCIAIANKQQHSCYTLATLLRSFWRKFLEKSVANCDKNVLVVSAKQDIPRFYQTWHNKVCVGRRCKPRRRVSEIFLMVTTDNHLTWSPPVDRRAVDSRIRRNLILPKILSLTTISQCSVHASTNCTYPAEQKEIAACAALAIWINARSIVWRKIIIT